MSPSKRLRLTIIGVILFIVFMSGMAYLISRSSTTGTTNEPQQNEVTTEPDSNEENADKVASGKDDHGDELSNIEQASVKGAAYAAAKEYFTYEPSESTEARRARLANFFTSDSRILAESQPPFASSNTVSVDILQTQFSPPGANQDKNELNVMITIEQTESSTPGTIVRAEKSAWIFLLREVGEQWKPYNLLPFDSAELETVRNSD